MFIATYSKTESKDSLSIDVPVFGPHFIKKQEEDILNNILEEIPVVIVDSNNSAFDESINVISSSVIL